MNAIIEKIKQQWGAYPIQMVGAVLLIICFILATLKLAVVFWATAIVVGLLDLYLIYVAKKITITKWIRGLTKRRVDMIILIALIPVCWALNGELVASWFLLGLLNSHLFEKD